MSAIPSDRNASRVDTLRVPPHSIEAEQAVLGGVMLVPKALAKISDWLKPEDFYRQAHKLIYETLIALATKSEPIDTITVGEWMEANGIAEQIGGPAYLTELANATASAANIEAYAEIVLEHSRRRKLIEIGTTIAGEAFDRGAQSEAVIASGIRKLSLMQSSRLRGGLQTARQLTKPWLEHMAALYQRGEYVTGMATPWAELNRLTHGLQDGDVIIVAGRPNMGKTVMGLQIAEYAAFDLRENTTVFSLEMSASQLVKRACARRRGVPYEWLMSPIGSEANWNEVTAFSAEFQDAPLMIDDTPDLTAEQIAGRARRAHMKKPLRLVVIDHLHRMKLLGKTTQDRQHELGECVKTFKAIAKEMRCPVVVLAQLNRNLTGRDDKHPQMSDLRESGAIEQEADLILFLHREDYYDKKTHLKGVVDVELGKGRDIKTGALIHLRNRFDVMRLDDWEGELPLPPVEGPKSRGGFRKRTSNLDPVAEAYSE